jgi:hypothetical protein
MNVERKRLSSPIAAKRDEPDEPEGNLPVDYFQTRD